MAAEWMTRSQSSGRSPESWVSNWTVIREFCSRSSVKGEGTRSEPSEFAPRDLSILASPDMPHPPIPTK